MNHVTWSIEPFHDGVLVTLLCADCSLKRVLSHDSLRSQEPSRMLIEAVHRITLFAALWHDVASTDGVAAVIWQEARVMVTHEPIAGATSHWGVQ